MTVIQAVWPLIIAAGIVTIALTIPVAMVYIGMFVVD